MVSITLKSALRVRHGAENGDNKDDQRGKGDLNPDLAPNGVGVPA